MTDPYDIIIKLKEVREERGLSHRQILKLMESNGDHLAISTISNVFADGSEDKKSFDYEHTLRPIAKALLDMETFEDDDPTDVRAMKSLLKYKMQRIEELEARVIELKATIDHEKVKYHEKLEKERERYETELQRHLHQIDLKDERMDKLLNAMLSKDKQIDELLKKLLVCQKCKEGCEQ